MRCLNCKQKFERKYQWQMGKMRFCLSTDECETAFSIAAAKKRAEQKEKKRKSAYKNKLTIHSSTYQTENKANLQREINTIVRLIDKGVRCIDCDRTESNPHWEAGHYKSVGSTSTLRYHLDNIFNQTSYCNSKSEGDKSTYRDGLDRMYGKEYLTHVVALKREIKILKLHHTEYPEFIKEARKIVRELKKADLTYPPKVRIRLRKEINKRLNIYKQEL